MALDQFGKNIASTGASNRLQLKMGDQAARSEKESNVAKMGFGVVIEVDVKTQRVRAEFLGTGDPIYSGNWLVLDNDPAEIINRWGKLRSGMIVRVFWKGRSEGRWAIGTIIGDETFSMFEKKPKSNELATGPFKVTGGGLMG